MEQKINFKNIQKQKLIITNKIKLAFKILSLPIFLLLNFLENEIEKNPLLEKTSYKKTNYNN